MSGTTVSLLRSTDTDAPRLSGTAGDLINLFYKCLDSTQGYNTHTLSSITRSGSVATATFAAHGYALDGLTKVQISGADQSEYNGIHSITNVTTNTFDFTVSGTPASGTGTIVACVAPLGWTRSFTGTNLAAFRSNEGEGTRLYLRVDDTGTTTARLRGYEVMSDVNTGTGTFPTDAQLSGGLWIGKSDAASTSSRPWVLVGDGYEFYFFYANHSTTYANIYRQFHFGDVCSEMESDPYGCLIYGDIASALAAPELSQTTNLINQTTLAAQAGHYFARVYTQTGTSVAACKVGNYTLGGSSIGYSTALLSYPSPANNGLYVSPLFIHDLSVVRGQLKGIYQPLHYKPLGNLTLLAANVSPISRRMLSISTAGVSANTGETHLDIDGPWR
jgi:hypothetical protein